MHYVVDDGHAEAAAAKRATRGEERIEHPRQVISRDTAALISHGQYEAIDSISSDVDEDRAAHTIWVGIALDVGQQVEEHLAEAATVAQPGAVGQSVVHDDADASFAGADREQLDHLVDHRHQVERFASVADLAYRQLLELRHQAVGTLDVPLDQLGCFFGITQPAGSQSVAE